MKKLKMVLYGDGPDLAIIREFEDAHADRLLANQESGVSPIAWTVVGKNSQTSEGYKLSDIVTDQALTTDEVATDPNVVIENPT